MNFEWAQNLLTHKTGCPGFLIKRIAHSSTTNDPFKCKVTIGDQRKFLMRQNLETMLIYTWQSCNPWTRLSLAFGEQDNLLVSECFLLPHWGGLTAIWAPAHKITGTHHDLVLQERPTKRIQECQPALPTVRIYKGCSFLPLLFITRLHIDISDSTAENINKLLILSFL